MPISNRNILVSGGGVAGSALATWLARRGFAPTVVDLAPEPGAEVGPAEVSRQGMALLDRMGLGERVRALGSPVDEVRTHVSGRREPACLPGEPGNLTVRHGDLVRALREDDGGVEYLLGDGVAALEQDDEGVDVTFAHAPARRFDLVVGADGRNSPVRTLAFPGPDDKRLRYLGANTAIFETANLLDADNTTAWHVWPHRGCLVTTLPGGDRASVVLVVRDRFPIDADSMDQDARRRWVEEAFGEDGWEMPRLLRAARDADVRVLPSTQVRMDVWEQGRVVLVGDAASCPDHLSGQGPTMALMGALALAGELVFTRGEHGRAFFSYEAALRQSVREAQTVAPYVVDSVAPEAGRYETWIRERAELALARGTLLMGRLGIRPPMDSVGGEFALERYAGILTA